MFVLTHSHMPAYRIVCPHLFLWLAVVVAVVEDWPLSTGRGRLQAELVAGDANKMPPAPVESLQQTRNNCTLVSN